MDEFLTTQTENFVVCMQNSINSWMRTFLFFLSYMMATHLLEYLISVSIGPSLAAQFSVYYLYLTPQCPWNHFCLHCYWGPDCGYWGDFLSMNSSIYVGSKEKEELIDTNIVGLGSCQDILNIHHTEGIE